jgi:hypothetical protein
MCRLALIVIVLGALAGGALASRNAKPSLHVTPNPVRAGHAVTLKGSAGGCTIGDTVTLLSRAFPAVHSFAGVPAVLTQVRAGGGFRTSTVIPLSKRGTYSVTGRCGGGNLGFFVQLRVTAPISLSVAPNPVRAGYVLLIRGSADSCPVGDTVTVLSHAFPATHQFAGVPAVLTPVRAGGAFHTQTMIPSTKRTGTYSITARCGGGNLGVLVHLRVTR